MSSYQFDGWLASEIDAAEREVQQDESWQAFLATQADDDFAAMLADPEYLRWIEQRAGEFANEVDAA